MFNWIMSEHKWGFKTKALHAGTQPDPQTGARALPIYQSSAFVFENTEDAGNLFALQKYGNIYSRIANPTVSAFEEKIAALEGGIGAVATSCPWCPLRTAEIQVQSTSSCLRA